MRKAIPVATLIVAAITIAASFQLGRLSTSPGRLNELRDEVPAKSRAPETKIGRSDQSEGSDEVRIENIAQISFGESWDLMRNVSVETRSRWARELQNLPRGPQRDGAMETFYKIWVQLDAGAAVKAVRTITDSEERMLAFDAIAFAAPDSVLPDVAALREELGYPDDGFRADITTRWASVDPVAVAHFLEAHPSSNNFRELATAWANVDPIEASKWMVSLNLATMRDPLFPHAEGTRRRDAAAGLIDAWLEKDRAEAAKFVRLHADDPDIGGTAPIVAFSLSTKSVAEALAFVQALPNEEIKKKRYRF